MAVEATYRAIREILNEARANAYRAVNSAMVHAYWHIGRVIVDVEQRGQERAGYGQGLLRALAVRLTAEFGRGFDERNLLFCRTFHLRFPIPNALRSELSWTHYRLLLKVERPEARQADDNPTIGLILCAEKNEAMAKYILLDESKSIFASKYKLYLPSEDELRKEIERERSLLDLARADGAATDEDPS